MKPLFQTGIIRDERYKDHATENGHPENPKRIEFIYETLDLYERINEFRYIPPRFVEKEELLLVHSPEFINKIASTAEKECCFLTPDTYTTAGTYQAARLSAGGLNRAIELVVSGELKNAFALVRPPGHHAERSRAMGFCFFNNIALGAKFAREMLGLQRVMIVDWDVHHGNGTQHCFEKDNSVLFFSVHRHPLFPGTGLFTEAGIGKGEGYTINVPLTKGYGDAEFVAIFEELLHPVAMEFEPELILVSAGFDTHKLDPIGKMKMTPTGFAALTRSLMNIADIYCNGKIVLVLEGGYHLKALGESVVSVLEELADINMCRISNLKHRASRKKLNYALHRSIHVHQNFWKTLKDKRI